MVRNKKKPLSIFVQRAKLNQYFPTVEVKISQYGRRLIWEGILQPTELSPTYRIRLEYILGQHPDVYVISPRPLPLAREASELPHIYNHEKQHLCLYFRRIEEWSSDKMIADTIIPWASEWLLHYEYWVLTGEWQGGGIEHK